MPLSLPHRTGRCTGVWRASGSRLWCPRCRQVYMASQGAIRAALEEVDAGLWLLDLTKEGRELLAAEEGEEGG